MTVRELRQQLRGINPEHIVVLAKDADRVTGYDWTREKDGMALCYALSGDATRGYTAILHGKIERLPQRHWWQRFTRPRYRAYAFMWGGFTPLGFVGYKLAAQAKVERIVG